jgi:hypothetical protein
MNIFFLHLIPLICAQMHCDKHVVKMILETCQMLCCVWHCSDPDALIYTPKYRLTHKNHPCNIWARKSTANYEWLCALGIELCKEYTYRYGKIHACEYMIKEMNETVPPIPKDVFSSPAQAMPNQYKGDDAVESYRTYYFFEKNNMLSWKNRDKPTWITDIENYFL